MVKADYILGTQALYWRLYRVLTKVLLGFMQGVLTIAHLGSGCRPLGVHGRKCLHDLPGCCKVVSVGFDSITHTCIYVHTHSTSGYLFACVFS